MADSLPVEPTSPAALYDAALRLATAWAAYAARTVSYGRTCYHTGGSRTRISSAHSVARSTARPAALPKLFQRNFATWKEAWL
jgi:hypothetical protein